MKIGLIGGTFDPVHNGHIRVAIEVKEEMDLDVVEFIPAPYPPHKLGKKILDFEKRVYFLKKAIKDISFLRINTIEGNREGPSYTLYTLQELKRIYKGDKIYFIIGGDEVKGFTKWYRWRELFSLSNFIVVGRKESDLTSLENFIETNFVAIKNDVSIWEIDGNNIFYVEIPRLEISSSMIRERVTQRRCIRGLVPDIIENDISIEYRKF